MRNKPKWYSILLVGLALLLGSSCISCECYTQRDLDAASQHGWDDGYTEGYDDGLAKGEWNKEEAVKQAHDNGYWTGYWAGYEDAQGEGYDRGHADGKAEGYALGCKACRKISGDGPQPPDGLSLTIISVTSPVSPGQDATLKARAPPGAQCTIIVYYKSGPGTALGLYSKQADSNGDVSWTWKVGTRTTPGNWRIVVTATYAGKTVSQETCFTVR